MKITLELLKKHGACEGQRNMFARLYPDGAELSVESLALAREQGLEVGWLECLIPLGRREDYYAATAAAWKAREATIAPAWAEFDAAIGAAREVYRAATAPAWEVYDAAIGAARAKYDAAISAAREASGAATATAWEEYDAAIGAALVAAFD